MANWMVGTTDRFRAAVSENGVTNQVACWANSDSGPEYCRAALLGDPFTPDGVERFKKAAPLGRLGLPGDVADACLFLASPAARWVTGANLRVDGGVMTKQIF
jgi:NAD(P)-dependent dehydrogenase (short-subunit alcohol dehydrogenase family)